MRFPALKGCDVQQRRLESVNVSFNVTQEVAAALRALRDTGLYGVDCASVAKELLRHALLDPQTVPYWQNPPHRAATPQESEVPMKLHRRTSSVQKARNEFDDFLLALEQKYQLTCAEIFSLLGAAIARYAKSLIQIERHPDDPDKSGDEA